MTIRLSALLVLLHLQLVSPSAWAEAPRPATVEPVLPHPALSMVFAHARFRLPSLDADQGVVSGTGAPSPSYTKTHLGTLDPSGAFPAAASDINERGQVVGSGVTSSGERHSFLWEKGTMTDLWTMGADLVDAYAISSKGHVVGTRAHTPNVLHAALWKDGVTTDLGVLDGHFGSAAVSINEQGLVVGVSYADPFDGGTIRSFRWQDGVMTHLGTLGGGYTHVMDINELSQAAGVSERSDGAFHAFLWQDGAMIDLGTLGGSFSVAFGINDRGQVVGYSSTLGDEQWHAFLWENGVMTDLGLLPGGLGGGTSSTAFDINAVGQVVGISDYYDSEGYDVRAFVWANGQMTDLGAGDVPLASAINNRGQIAGWDGGAVLWEPTLGWEPPNGGGLGETASITAAVGAPSGHGSSRLESVIRVTTRPGILPIEFSLRGVEGPYSATIHDLQGRAIRRWNAVVTGETSDSWDGKGLEGLRATPGVYFLRIEAQGRSWATKVVLAR